MFFPSFFFFFFFFTKSREGEGFQLLSEFRPSFSQLNTWGFTPRTVPYIWAFHTSLIFLNKSLCKLQWSIDLIVCRISFHYRLLSKLWRLLNPSQNMFSKHCRKFDSPSSCIWLKHARFWSTYIVPFQLFNDDGGKVNDDAEHYDWKGLGNVAQSLSQGVIALQSHIDTHAVQCVPL